MRFPVIQSLSDLQPVVAHKKEIRFAEHPNGVTLACYMFMDSATFDSPHALECRGIAFDREGRICSRPLHKFFNVGEKEWLAPATVLAADVARISEKLDGSMIATAWVDGALAWRSKKSFASDVVKLTEAFIAEQTDDSLLAFSTLLASSGYTAIFELTHPQARIVVEQDRPQLRLLHVRHNVTGDYVLLDPAHEVHGLIRRYEVPCVPLHSIDVEQSFAALESMQGQEGYVLQFPCGDMAKIKCPWYSRLHKSITFLRERDIAMAALCEELDDIKGALTESGIDLAEVNAVESRVKARLVSIMEDVESAMRAATGMDRKSFAIAHKSHPLFGLLMTQYQGKEIDVSAWFIKHHLKDEFSLRVLADGALADAIEG